MAKPKLSGEAIRIVGLEATVDAFAKVDRELPKSLKYAMLAIAHHIVAATITKMPWQSGEAENSLKAKATPLWAGIERPAGGLPYQKGDADYYPWLDFGGAPKSGRGVTASSRIAHAKSTGGFRRPVIKGGRYMYPAIAESADYIRTEVDDAIVRITEAAGL
jgi:hypothetical protein